MGHMRMFCLSQPYMTVYTTTAIPTGVWLVAIVHSDGNNILTFLQIFCDIIFKRTIAIRTESHFLTIHINGRVHINAIKLNEAGSTSVL